MRNLLKKNGVFYFVTYRDIYPTGSQLARLYGLPKLRKVKDPRSTVPPFRPIVSSIVTYNYNLAKYLCSLLKPHISSEFLLQIFSLVRLRIFKKLISVTYLWSHMMLLVSLQVYSFI